MKLKQIGSFRGQKRARKIGLSSSRFSGKQMTENAREAIDYVKKKDRSDMKLSEWSQQQLYRSDATQQLFDCPENIPRENASRLSVREFVEQYQKKNMPVVIGGCTEEWNTSKYWNYEYFYREFKDVKFKIGEDDDGYKLRVPLKYYFEYLVYNKDDSPLYLFESSLENNREMRQIIDHYRVPPYFHDDLLKYAGERDRPPYRWLLMGPERSGSTVHIDPLLTAAWNTSLFGHKRWVLFPEHIPKSIVKGKKFRGKNYEDEAINYFTSIIPQIIQSQGRQRLGIIEFIQKPGETVFVPGGWWHAVINLDDTMALTQNVMTHTNFDRVWKSIRSQRRKFAKRFLENLKKQEYPLYERAIKLNQKDLFTMGEKYQKQSVSLSFTPSQSSSSSSSDMSESESNESDSSRKNDRSRSFSRSRDKQKKRKKFRSESKTHNSH